MPIHTSDPALIKVVEDTTRRTSVGKLPGRGCNLTIQASQDVVTHALRYSWD